MTVPVATEPPQARSVPVSERVLAPDLARGFALLLVALAHTTGIANGNIPGVDQTPHGLERPYLVVLFLFVHACALPLFSMMFGYGLVQFINRQNSLGVSVGETRRSLLRRHVGLLVLGAAHGILLFVGDVLGAFAIVGLAFTVLVLHRAGWVYRLGLIYLAFATVYVGVMAGLTFAGLARGQGNAQVPVGPDTSAALDSYPAAVLDRLSEWPISTLFLLTTALFALVGAWAARRRVLEEPSKNVRLLRLGFLGGFGLAVVGALPMALLAGDFVTMDAGTAGLAKIAYESAGLFGAVGYVSLFGLVALRLSKRQGATMGAVVGALVALGQRSLSFYLFQSVVWLVLFSSFTLHLGDRTASPTFVAAGCAFGVWLVSLTVAAVMRRHGFRGPVELLIRRFAYTSKR